VKRSGIAPDIPTMAESGYPGFEAVPWFGLMAPSGTSPAIIDRLYRDTVKVLATPDLRKKFNDLGLDVIGDSPAEFTAAIEREIPQWARVIKQAGIKAEALRSPLCAGARRLLRQARSIRAAEA
jgi:tripartite-type tricarboxylate transporter receptor subunit TctC